MISNENGKLTLKNIQGHKVVITAEPLKFEFLDKNGETAVVLNDNAQLFVEPLKVRNGDGEENDVVSALFVFCYCLLLILVIVSIKA